MIDSYISLITENIKSRDEKEWERGRAEKNIITYTLHSPNTENILLYTQPSKCVWIIKTTEYEWNVR